MRFSMTENGKSASGFPEALFKLSTMCRQLERQKQKHPEKFLFLLLLYEERGLSAPLSSLSPCLSKFSARICLQSEEQKQKLPEKFLFCFYCTKKGGSPPPLFALPLLVEALCADLSAVLKSASGFPEALFLLLLVVFADALT